MPSRLQVFCSGRLAARQALFLRGSKPLCLRLAPNRSITANEKPLPEADNATKGPNQEQLPHVSEEAGATSEIMGEKTKPEVEEQGTPVQEVLKRDGEAATEKAPKVIQQGIDKSMKGSRSYSTTSRRRAELQTIAQPAHDVVMNYQQTGEGLTNRQSTDLAGKGHIFGLPSLPIPKNMHLKRREDPMVDQFTKLILQSGKLSQAQSTMAMILERLRTAPPPRYDPKRSLIPGAPPASHLPLDPVLYLTLAVDSAAPLFRIRAVKGAAGGGVALQVPTPLDQRQRRRTSIMWILSAASKKRSQGSGRTMFANKVADELAAVIEGRSPIWEKRQGIHKLGVAARINLNSSATRKGRSIG